MNAHNHYLQAPEMQREPDIWHGFGARTLSPEMLAEEAAARQLAVVGLDQKHSDIIRVLDGLPAGSQEGDALVTNRAGILLVIKTADCLPVLLADSERPVIAAVHCGWRGTSRRLVSQVVDTLAVRFGSSPRNLKAALGPCISGSRYQVGSEVRAAFAADDPALPAFRSESGQKGRFRFDLREANRLQLLASGLAAADIFSVELCTAGDPGLHSYRRDGQAAGRFLTFIGRRPRF